MPGDFIRTFQRALYSRVVLVGSILVCAFLFFQLVQVVSRSTSTGKEIASLRSEVESLQTEQKRLEQLRSFLQTDFFAEQEARTKFGLQKEGEHALILSKQNSEPRIDPHDDGSARGDTRHGGGMAFSRAPPKNKKKTTIGGGSFSLVADKDVMCPGVGLFRRILAVSHSRRHGRWLPL